jgi:hypothetical protein
VIAGIEVTAVENGATCTSWVFLRSAQRRARRFLTAQRADRIRRVREMGARLGESRLPAWMSSTPQPRAEWPAASAVRRLRTRSSLPGIVRHRNDAFARLLGRG